MKKLITYIAMLVFGYSFAQKSITISQVLNIASKQSMLCERLAKEKVFNATYPNNYNVEKKLIVSLIQFERNISILNSFELPEEIVSTLTKTEALWPDYRKSLLDKSHDSTVEVLEHNSNIYSSCEKLFSDLLNYAKTNELYPYNSNEEFSNAYIASNEIKNLSQKFSLFYNAYYSKAIDTNIDFDSIINKIESFVTSIGIVKNINAEIKEKTIEIENEWNELKNITSKIVDADFTKTDTDPKPEEVLIKTNKLLKDADLLTRLYTEYNNINQKD